MANYNYLKIDFYGQFDNDTLHKFTYPEPYNRANVTAMAWLNPVKDYRNTMRSLFPNVNICYKIHTDNNGIYYSMIFKNADDTRGGYVTITVLIGNKYTNFIDGEAILTLLNLLKINVVEAKNYTVDAIEKSLIASNMPQEQVPELGIMSRAGALTALAFRTYGNTDELMDLFQFPLQADYKRYCDVFLVPQQFAPQAPSNVMTRLTAPIVRVYNVDKPANVQVQGLVQGRAHSNSNLKVTYNRPGFAPITVPVPVNGVSSQYVSYNKGTLTILEPTNMQFKQRVMVQVKVNKHAYNDQKVTASIGGVPLVYNNGAYVAEVSPEQLAGSEVKLTVDVEDPNLVTKSSQQVKEVPKYIYRDSGNDDSDKKNWLWPLVAFIVGALIAVGATALWNKVSSKEEQQQKQEEQVDPQGQQDPQGQSGEEYDKDGNQEVEDNPEKDDAPSEGNNPKDENWPRGGYYGPEVNDQQQQRQQAQQQQRQQAQQQQRQQAQQQQRQQAQQQQRQQAQQQQRQQAQQQQRQQAQQQQRQQAQQQQRKQDQQQQRQQDQQKQRQQTRRQEPDKGQSVADQYNI